FALFAYGDPATGLWMILFSCIVYGMAFDFFNISGSLFVETNTNAKIRSSAQGLFMMMTNGFRAVIGSNVVGWAIDKYFTKSFTSYTYIAVHMAITIDKLTFIIILKVAYRVHINERVVLGYAVLLSEWRGI